MANNIRLSASRINTYLTCSMVFYYENLLNLPSKTHPKTLVGTLAHAIAEYIRKPKWKHLLDEMDCGDIINYKGSKTITKLVDLFQQKYDIPFNLLDDINGMLTVLFKHFDFWKKDAEKQYPPEFEFIFKVGDYELKGIIDALAEYKDQFVIIDYKTKGKVFSTKELNDNIQSSIYQLFIYKKYGKLSKVQFVMLRHAPTKLKPKKFLQEVPAKTPDQLMGVEQYLIEMGRFFNKFTYKDALSGMCKDEGFCRYVCQFREKFTYLQVLDKNNQIVKNYLMSDLDKIVLKDGERINIFRHEGCPKYNE